MGEDYLELAAETGAVAVLLFCLRTILLQGEDIRHVSCAIHGRKNPRKVLVHLR